MKNQLLLNLFLVFHRLAPWVPQPDKGHYIKTFDLLYFSALENLRMAISNDFLLYSVVIRKALWIWPNTNFL